MGVDLRGGDAGMAEQLLHQADIRPTVKEVGGKGVPEHVRCERLLPTEPRSI